MWGLYFVQQMVLDLKKYSSLDIPPLHQEKKYQKQHYELRSLFHGNIMKILEKSFVLSRRKEYSLLVSNKMFPVLVIFKNILKIIHAIFV
jgi:hypothetical protein